jgi:hypothetical protein
MAALRFPRVDRLGAADWLLLGEALLVLGWASLAIAILPFRRVAASASLRPRGPGRGGAVKPAKIRWAVDAWGRRVPWKAVCFQRGLAAHIMLRRRGLNSILHYGVARKEEEGLSAHVWVSLDGTILLGGREAPDFICLATFPSAPQSAPIA